MSKTGSVPKPASVPAKVTEGAAILVSGSGGTAALVKEFAAVPVGLCSYL